MIQVSADVITAIPASALEFGYPFVRICASCNKGITGDIVKTLRPVFLSEECRYMRLHGSIVRYYGNKECQHWAEVCYFYPEDL